ncbi:MAG: MlaE family lipid ABC transporter permease subunit [Alphaproteobacteria bacterium]|nr:MAG: MlaE family lipid ABC transporter permease subunit [Alphaproteobacteria bacterium]
MVWCIGSLEQQGEAFVQQPVLSDAAPIQVEQHEGVCVIRATGAWTIDTSATVAQVLNRLSPAADQTVQIDLDGLSALDTTGAWLLYRLKRDLRYAGFSVSFVNVRESYGALIEAVAQHDAPCPISPPAEHSLICQIEDLGRGTVRAFQSLMDLVGYTGLVVAAFARVIANPRRMRWASLVHHLEHVGLKAMPIVGLMSLLIGVVIAQQGEFQLRRFGGEYFVVDLLGISILREIGILLTAIMVAGRSGSAFTAQIGTMMLNEEVDAIRTLGIDPVETLVLPRVLALIIMLPALTFYSDIVALLGGGLFAWLSLDISPGAFIRRLNDAITLDTFLVGMYKAPFFAAVIAIAGCFEGMRVRGGAESVGEHTTRSVVESIFLVIVLDAMFAVFFSTIGM